MLHRNLFLSVLVTNCAINNRPIAADNIPSSLNVEKEIQIIPKIGCEVYAGWIARSLNAERASQLYRLSLNHNCNTSIEKLSNELKTVNDLNKQNEKDLSKYRWLATYGLPIGIAIGIALTTSIALSVVTQIR